MTNPTAFDRRDLTHLGDFDVIVCGGGPAGLGAALAAARSGAETLLIEQHGLLGGLWTMGMVTPFFDAANKKGLSVEIARTMQAADLEGFWINPDQTKTETKAAIYPVGPLARLFDKLCVNAGVTVQLHTMIDEVVRDGDTVTGVVLHSKSGPQTASAKTVIDCTGDGDVAAAAGCEFKMGRDEDGACQPATVYALVGGAPDETIYPEPINEAIQSAGGKLTYAHPYLFALPGTPGVSIFMATHLYNLDATDAAAVSICEIEGRRQIEQALTWLTASGAEQFKDLFLIQFAGQIGIRESRRILGKHYLTIDEVLAGCRFDDGICQVTFNVDIHAQTDDGDLGLETQNVPMYEIPYRSLVPCDRRGILTAGRCISGDAIAHASYRVTGTAAALGEAAGVAAALAARTATDVSALDGTDVRAALDAYYQSLPTA